MEKRCTSEQDTKASDQDSFSVIQHAFFFCVSNSLKHLFENLTLYNIIRTITLNILLVLIPNNIISTTFFHI